MTTLHAAERHARLAGAFVRQLLADDVPVEIAIPMANQYVAITVALDRQEEREQAKATPTLGTH